MFQLRRSPGRPPIFPLLCPRTSLCHLPLISLFAVLLCFAYVSLQFGCRRCCVVPLPGASPGSVDVDMTHLAIAITGVILLVRNGRLALSLRARFKIYRAGWFGFGSYVYTNS